MNEARDSGRAEADASMSAQQWAARIESLYRSGDIAAAEAELRRLRLAHPGAEQQLPDALRAWAASVQ